MSQYEFQEPENKDDNQPDIIGDFSREIQFRSSPLLFKFPPSKLSNLLDQCTYDEQLNIEELGPLLIQQFGATHNETQNLYIIPGGHEDIVSTDYIGVIWNIEQGNELIWFISDILQKILRLKEITLKTRITRRTVNSAINFNCLQFYDELINRFEEDTLMSFNIHKLVNISKSSVRDAINLQTSLNYVMESVIQPFQDLGIDFSSAHKLPSHLRRQLINHNNKNTTQKIELNDELFFVAICAVILCVSNYSTNGDLTYHFRNTTQINGNSVKKTLYLLAKYNIIKIKIDRQSISYCFDEWTEDNNSNNNAMLYIFQIVDKINSTKFTINSMEPQYKLDIKTIISITETKEEYHQKLQETYTSYKNTDKNNNNNNKIINWLDNALKEYKKIDKIYISRGALHLQKPNIKKNKKRNRENVISSQNEPIAKKPKHA